MHSHCQHTSPHAPITSGHTSQTWSNLLSLRMHALLHHLFFTLPSHALFRYKSRLETSTPLLPANFACTHARAAIWKQDIPTKYCQHGTPEDGPCDPCRRSLQCAGDNQEAQQMRCRLVVCGMHATSMLRLPAGCTLMFAQVSKAAASSASTMTGTAACPIFTDCRRHMLVSVTS